MGAAIVLKKLLIFLALSKSFSGSPDVIKDNYPINYRPEAEVIVDRRYSWADSEIKDIKIKNPTVKKIVEAAMKRTIDRLEYDFEQLM